MIIHASKASARARGYLYSLFMKGPRRGLFIGAGSTILGLRFINIGRDVRIGKRARIEAFSNYGRQRFSPELRIGDHTIINDDVHIGVCFRVSIGRNVLLASRIYISDHSHGDAIIKSKTPPRTRDLTSRGPVEIEDNVWIGEGVVILSGVKIGAGSIIGANSVVTKSVPSGVVVAGSPAKIIRHLS